MLSTKLHLQSPHLMTTSSVTILGYNSTEWRNLKPFFIVVAATASLWSCDCNLDTILIMVAAESHSYVIIICNLHCRLPKSEVNGESDKKLPMAITWLQPSILASWILGCWKQWVSSCFSLGYFIGATAEDNMEAAKQNAACWHVLASSIVNFPSLVWDADNYRQIFIHLGLLLPPLNRIFLPCQI